MTPYLPAHAPSPRPHKPLSGDTSCDVCVIGGGLCGLLTAHLLKQAGLSVVLLEAGRLLSGQTRGTTAKLTVQHGLFASQLIQSVGLPKAQAYAEANLRALGAFKTLLQSCSDDCGFVPQRACLYTLHDPQLLEEELLAYRKLGLSGEIVSDGSAPLDVRACLCMEDQAQMNPFPLLCALASDLPIYEHTRALALEGGAVVTQRGAVHAKAVAVCTHYPAFNLPGLYFLRLYQERSYTLAIRPAAGSKAVDGLFYGIDADSLSLRPAGDAVLIGGESHRCGNKNTAGCYERLRKKAQRLFPEGEELSHWSAQDCMTMDGVPYVGKLCAMTPDVYVATGFGKWGMTNAMAAAQLIRDEIVLGSSPYAFAFSPQRLPGASYARGLLAHAGHTACDFSRSLAPIVRAAESLTPGEGAIVADGLRKIAAYRDESGTLHQISPYCAHMKCLLQFNPDEKSWDCPCHGSRFTVDGELICGPAQKDLPKKG